MTIANPHALAQAVKYLLEVLSEEDGEEQRTVFASQLKKYAVLTADLHTIAASANFFLKMPEQKSHALCGWTISYKPDGIVFVATAPPAK